MVRKYSFNLCVHLPLHIESGNIAVSDIQNPSWNFFIVAHCNIISHEI